MIITINSPFDTYQPSIELTSPKGEVLSLNNRTLKAVWGQKTQVKSNGIYVTEKGSNRKAVVAVIRKKESARKY